MLKGLPGTGKTTTILVMASKLNYSIRIINFTPQLTDDNFMELVSNCPKKTILLLEDIDELFVSNKKNDENRNMVSFSAILNVLDGISGKEDLITIMTTNNIEFLEDKLIRNGRIDNIFTFEYMKKAEIKKMFINFSYVSQLIEMDKYNELINDPTLSAAQIEKIKTKHYI